MKKRTQTLYFMMLAGFFVIVSLAMTGACLAEGIVAVHGHAGHIERMNNVDNPDNVYMGWGVDIDQKSGFGNWVHYSIPIPPGNKTRYLLVYYETGATGSTADSMINALHVFDGRTRIYEKDPINLTGGPKYELIDMGEDKTITNALGLTIGIGAGVESMSHRMRIYAVWAEWH